MNHSLTSHDSKLTRNQWRDRPERSGRARQQAKEDKRSLFKHEVRVGKFSGAVKESSVSGESVGVNRLPSETSARHVETGLLQLLKSTLGFCQACQTQRHAFTPTLARTLSTLCERIWCNDRSILGKQRWANRLTEEKLIPSLPSIAQYSLEAVGAAFRFLPSKTESMSSLYLQSASILFFLFFFPQDFQAG